MNKLSPKEREKLKKTPRNPTPITKQPIHNHRDHPPTCNFSKSFFSMLPKPNSPIAILIYIAKHAIRICTSPLLLHHRHHPKPISLNPFSHSYLFLFHSKLTQRANKTKLRRKITQPGNAMTSKCKERNKYDGDGYSQGLYHYSKGHSQGFPHTHLNLILVMIPLMNTGPILQF